MGYTNKCKQRKDLKGKIYVVCDNQGIIRTLQEQEAQNKIPKKN